MHLNVPWSSNSDFFHLQLSFVVNLRVNKRTKTRCSKAIFLLRRELAKKLNYSEFLRIGKYTHWLKYLLHGCTGANKLHGKALQRSFHTAIFTRDDEIYHERVVPRVLKPWLMQHHAIISNWRVSDQSAARFILRQPISVKTFDVSELDLPVVKLVSRGLCTPFHLAYVGDPVFSVGSCVWREYLAAKKCGQICIKRSPTRNGA